MNLRTKNYDRTTHPDVFSKQPSETTGGEHQGTNVLKNENETFPIMVAFCV